MGFLLVTHANIHINICTMKYSEILDEEMMTKEVTRSMTRAICTQLSVTCTDDIRLYTLTDE